VDYDVLIVGAGFAGAEAAYALARQGSKVGLITTSLDSVYLPFTPITRPFPDGSLLAEVGEDGLKGWELHSRAKYKLENQPNLHLIQSSVTKLRVRDGAAVGVETWEGPSKTAPKIVLALGSFLVPKLFIGTVAEDAGRLSEVAYPDLYEHLLELGFSFTTHTAEVSQQAGALGYRVEYKVFAAAQWDQESLKLGRLEGLYAIGLCSLGGGTYSQMAQHGLRLAELLAQV
jgi:hypothetical protein